MDTLDWIITVVCLAVTGATFLRLVAIGREARLWLAQVEAEEALQAERGIQEKKAAAMTQLRDVEMA